jgi:hypothetical protein
MKNISILFLIYNFCKEYSPSCAIVYLSLLTLLAALLNENGRQKVLEGRLLRRLDLPQRGLQEVEGSCGMRSCIICY